MVPLLFSWLLLTTSHEARVSAELTARAGLVLKDACAVSLPLKATDRFVLMTGYVSAFWLLGISVFPGTDELFWGSFSTTT